MMGVKSCSINPTGCDLTNIVVKSRRLAAANSHWRVYYDHLVDDRGNEVSDYLSVEGDCPRADRVAGVEVLPVLGDKLLLLRVYRHPLGRDLWEVPRGFIDANETAADAALRELYEETGLHCAPGDLLALGMYAPEPSTMAVFGAQFAATRCQGTPRRPNDEIGIGAFALLDPKQVAELIVAGEIAHSGTLLLYYRYCELQR
jgi:8-oxo-dGTP pyrophosphatase MutT (NUDIX family)